jgi:DNA-binding winged helix-turn-helix (wHTH) protein/tetratricopeptide (TPR) repeat protein
MLLISNALQFYIPHLIAVLHSRHLPTQVSGMEQTLSNQIPRFIRFGVFEVDTQSGELRKAGIRLRLQGQPLQVLMILLERGGEVVTREELRSRIWPGESFGDTDHALNKAIARIRETLDDSAETPRYIETLPRHGYRFIGTVSRPISAPKSAWSRWASIIGASVVVVGVAAGSLWWLNGRKAHALSPTDTVVLADFTNKTGDAVFDGTLREGLAVQLQQSPFLSLISDEHIHQTLHLMGQPAGAKLTPEIARDLCVRTGSAAFLEGSIAQIGTRYDVILKAVNCSNGGSVASTEAQASDKSHVLDALSKASSELRKKLGESLAMVKKFDMPLEEAATPSLEALQAYSLGIKALGGEADSVAAAALFQRAIKLDPDFADAYVMLGYCYSNLGENGRASENMRKAFDLLNHMSGPEKFHIEGDYEFLVTGNLGKAQRAFEVAAQTYPRDWFPPLALGNIDQELGDYERSLEEFRRSFRFDANGLTYVGLAGTYVLLNRLAEARATAEEAGSNGVDYFHNIYYMLAFLQNDKAGMQQEVAWATGKTGVEDVLLGFEASTSAYFGRMQRSREFSRRAVVLAERADEKETAASYEADEAVTEALFGNRVEARNEATAALRLSTGRDVQYAAALATALAEDSTGAVSLVDDLVKRFPEDTIIQLNYSPTVHAQVSLNMKNVARAFNDLQISAPYELGSTPAALLSLYPVFVHGQAYLAARQGSEAVAEFEKILDHRGVVLNEAIVPLAHLGLARAYALQGDTSKARASYQDFLTLWKDADPDIPILKEAKAEYAKLQ